MCYNLSQIRHIGGVRTNLKSIQNSFLLKGIPESELESAVSLLSPTVTEHPKGCVLAAVGEAVRELRFLERGSALVYRDAEHKTILSRLGPGDCFGAANLFGEDPTYPTEIVSDSAVTCIRISEADLVSFFTAYSASALNYIAFLSNKIRFLNRRVGDFSCGSAEKKVARLLILSLDEGDSLMLGNLCRTAEEIGLGRASLYRVLADLEGRDIIRKDGKKITVLNTNQLKGILS